MATRLYAPPLLIAEPSAQRLSSVRVARLLEGVIFYALLALIPLTAVPYGTVEEWWASAFQCVVFALAGLWAVEGLLGGGWLVREHRLLVPLLALLVFIFFQSIPLGQVEVGGLQVWRTLSADAFETRLVAFRFLALILVAAMLLRYVSSQRRLRSLIYCVIAVGVMSAVFGIVRQAAQHGEESFILPHLKSGYGQFINRNHFALLMEMALGLVLGLLAERGAWRQGLRLFSYLMAGVLIWSALVLANSRGGIFGLIGEVLLIALLYRASRGGMRGDAPNGFSRSVKYALLRSALVVSMLVVVVIGIVWMGGDPLVRKMETLRTEVGAEGAGDRLLPRRSEMWYATWQMIEEHPTVGTGFGGYWRAIDGYYDAIGAYVPEQAHNDYLEIIASGGLLAVALTAWFIAAVVKRARKKCLRARGSLRRAACLGALAGLCAVAIHSFVDFGLHVTINALVFTALVVIAVAHVRLNEQDRDGNEGRARRLPSRFREASGVRLPPRRSTARTATALICLLGCPFLMWATARAGLSRWYSLHPDREHSLSLADKAVRLSPSDPTAHLFRASILSTQDSGAASKEFERALSLRPEDHFFWLSLGLARQSGGDLTGALTAFEEAVRLAPYYAQPRWQLGNALLRAGKPERAVAELSRAAASDPELLPQTLELLWGALEADADAMIEAMSAQSTAAQVSLALFLKEHDQMAEAIELLSRAGSAADAERRQLTAELISAKRFEEAYRLWSSGHGDNRAGELDGPEVITNGDFEDDVDLNGRGFGWQLRNNRTLLISLDAKEMRDGPRSLRLDFKGELPTQSPIISQLVFAKANARYRLSFAARTQELITAEAPLVAVLDATTEVALGESTPLRHGSNDWQDYTIEFSTGKTTSVLMITAQRQNCARRPCLIFGRVWLDNFSLQRLSTGF
ncbi:MAG: O-antigen ligase family protein [Pyrinomonadaceae bacterium]